MIPSRSTLCRAARGFHALLMVPALLSSLAVAADDHPRLLTSAAEAEAMRAAAPLPPLYQAAVDEARAAVDPLLDAPPDVPVPVDGGGGHTHERHKANAVAIYRAGQLFLLSGDARYADFAADLLDRYADLYPGLGRHPVIRSSTPGRLFWQSLNETVWLVYAIQGYDAIYHSLDDDRRARLERDLFRPLAAFLSTEQPKLFDKIHNHGTWAVAAVGMTGYALGDDDMVHQALYGLDGSGTGGFLRQLDELFSPDGYYSEGPYYQRYALMPFVLFAQAIDRNDPERDIFGYRDGVLSKAIEAAIQLTYAWKFFPINDAIKAKGLDTPELIFGVTTAWAQTGDRGLFPIARYQGRAALNGAGFRLAEAAAAGGDTAFEFRTMNFRDGPEGDRGQLSVLRSGPGVTGQALVFKATAQGMNHGHFDRLAWLFYDDGREVVSDYGSARFLNVVEKHGGHYLPENESWAKQTLAHHTLVVDGESQFGGDWRVGEETGTEALFFEAAPGGGVAAARVERAWDGVALERTVAMLQSRHFPRPLVFDRMRARSDDAHDYDLPFYYRGQLTTTSHAVEAFTERQQALGDDNGYQHLWQTGHSALPADEAFRLTWLNGARFYTWTVLPPADTEVLFTRTGAGDPEFNLRGEPGVLLRTGGQTDATWFAVLEPHGAYDSAREFTVGSASAIERVERYAGETGDVIRVETTGGVTLLALAHAPDPDAEHRVDIPGRTVRWTGYFQLIDD